MRIVGYRWDELAAGCDMSSRLNIQWQRTFGEASFNGYSIESYPLNREILVFEGDSEEIRRIQRIVEEAHGRGSLGSGSAQTLPMTEEEMATVKKHPLGKKKA